MKRLLVLLTCLLLVAAFIGCGQQEAEEDTGAAGQPEEMADTTRMDSAQEMTDTAAGMMDTTAGAMEEAAEETSGY